MLTWVASELVCWVIWVECVASCGNFELRGGVFRVENAPSHNISFSSRYFIDSSKKPCMDFLLPNGFLRTAFISSIFYLYPTG